MLPLHVFEPRYRQMAARCLETDRRFGVLFHDPDLAGPFELREAAIGCVAEILRFQPLPDGRSLMLTRGLHRFRVADGIESDTLFTEALVEGVADESTADPERRRSSLDLFLRVLRANGGDAAPQPDLDVDQDISFPIAGTFQIDPAWRQHLLERRSEPDRLDEVDRILRTAI